MPGIKRKPERAKQRQKGAKECPWVKTRVQKARESQGSRVKIPQKWTLKLDATSFHPKNPWRGKLQEEEIIVLHLIGILSWPRVQITP